LSNYSVSRQRQRAQLFIWDCLGRPYREEPIAPQWLVPSVVIPARRRVAPESRYGLDVFRIPGSRLRRAPE